MAFFVAAAGCRWVLVPFLCLYIDVSAKCLYKVANMELTLACINNGKHHDDKGHGFKLFAMLHLADAVLMNLPLAIMQVIFLHIRSFKFLVVVALFFSFTSFVYDILVIFSDGLKWTALEVRRVHCRSQLQLAIAQINSSGTELGSERRKEVNKALLEPLLYGTFILRMSEEPVSLQAQMLIRDELHAVDTTWEELKVRLQAHGAPQDDNAEEESELVFRRQFVRTATACLNTLADGKKGGCVFVVLHPELSSKVRCQTLDGGFLLKALNEICPNGILQDPEDDESTAPSPLFVHAVHSAASSHSANDRWGPDEIATLVNKGNCPISSEVREGLNNQPMDGAFIFSYTGKPEYAAVKLGHMQERWELKKTDGTSAGTRHAGSLSLAVWLGSSWKGWPSVVFVRSDAGGLHAFFEGRHGRAPRAYYLAHKEGGWGKPSI